MGVKTLFSWQVANVASELQALRNALASLDALPPRGQPMPWRVRYNLSRQVSEVRNAPQVLQYRLEASDCPGQVCLVLGNHVVLSSANFEQLSMKLLLLKTRMSASIEGYKYYLEDFVVRIGSVRWRQALNTIVVEVEYRPCVDPEGALGIMRELAHMVGVPPQALRLDWPSVVISGSQQTNQPNDPTHNNTNNQHQSQGGVVEGARTNNNPSRGKGGILARGGATGGTASTAGQIRNLKLSAKQNSAISDNTSAGGSTAVEDVRQTKHVSRFAASLPSQFSPQHSALLYLSLFQSLSTMSQST